MGTNPVQLDPIIRTAAWLWLSDNDYKANASELCDSDLRLLIQGFYPGGFKAFCTATWASVESAEAEALTIF